MPLSWRKATILSLRRLAKHGFSMTSVVHGISGVSRSHYLGVLLSNSFSLAAWEPFFDDGE